MKYLKASIDIGTNTAKTLYYQKIVDASNVPSNLKPIYFYGLSAFEYDDGISNYYYIPQEKYKTRLKFSTDCGEFIQVNLVDYGNLITLIRSTYLSQVIGCTDIVLQKTVDKLSFAFSNRYRYTSLRLLK